MNNNNDDGQTICSMSRSVKHTLTHRSSVLLNWVEWNHFRLCVTFMSTGLRLAEDKSVAAFKFSQVRFFIWLISIDVNTEQWTQLIHVHQLIRVEKSTILIQCTICVCMCVVSTAESMIHSSLNLCDKYSDDDSLHSYWCINTLTLACDSEWHKWQATIDDTTIILFYSKS